MRRQPFRAGSFYPASKTECKKMIDECMTQWDTEDLPCCPGVGIVPHAGWVFSGPTAAGVFKNFQTLLPETFVIFGAVHVPGVRKATVYPAGSWDTPLGEMEIDRNLCALIKNKMKSLIAEDSSLHDYEHSIEVQVPFIQHLFPKSRLVAIMVPPDSQSHIIGREIGEIIKNLSYKTAVLGSTDLTHYGEMNFGFAPMGAGINALRWVKNENDRSMIDKILDMRDDAIVQEAAKNRNACGSGAVAAAVGCARVLGLKKGRLLNYTTSYDVMPEGQPSDFVGYAGIIFQA